MQPSQVFTARVRAQAAAAALACSLPLAALAQPQGGPPGGPQLTSTWSLGVGVASMQAPYRGMDREAKLLPFVRYENRYFKISGLGGEVKLPGLRLSDTQEINFGLVGRFDMSGYEADDSPFLTGMAERKGGLWAGARAEWDNPWATVTAEWTGDASGNSKGQKFSLGLERTWRLGQKFMLTPGVTATRHDQKYVDYYYGVRANEVRAGRAAYTGEAGTNVEVALRGMYVIDRNNSLMLSVGTTRLASEIKKSPLVNRTSENRIILGYVYRFQ